jgi:hypothetical protein
MHERLVEYFLSKPGVRCTFERSRSVGLIWRRRLDASADDPGLLPEAFSRDGTCVRTDVVEDCNAPLRDDLAFLEPTAYSSAI